MPKKMMLYVWEDFCCDYTPGIAFAIASSVEEARELVLKNMGETIWREDELKREHKEYSLKEKVGFGVTGGS